MTTNPRPIGRAVAIAIACAAPVVMAAAQAMVIRDRVAIVHPAWPPWAVAAMAIGFELCILTAGLAIVVTGHRDKWLLGGELFLVVMSVAVAVTSALDLAPWVLSMTIALVPLQYMVAFHAAHALYTHWYAVPTVTVVPVAAPVKAVPKAAQKAAPRPAGNAPAEWHGAALALLRDGLRPADVARHPSVNVHPSQVTRLKARMGGQAVAQ